MAFDETNRTALVISGVGLQWAGIGMRQTLKPVDGAAQVVRTVNGELIDLSDPNWQKYASSISGNDAYVPAIDDIWPGREVTVDCVAELAYETATSGPARTIVTGSEREEGAYTYYRPRLTMRVMDFQVEEDEWGKVVTWTMDLEEV